MRCLIKVLLKMELHSAATNWNHVTNLADVSGQIGIESASKIIAYTVPSGNGKRKVD